MWPFTAQKRRQQEALFYKLCVVARGDIGLVQQAIRSCAPSRTDPADIEEVLAFIIARRAPRSIPSPE